MKPTTKVDGGILDPTKPFQFIKVDDYGSPYEGGGTCCPHCGADGRYIYWWAEYGVIRGAMAGCYKALTGQIKKTDVDQFLERLNEKVVKGKPLSGFYKTVASMQKYIVNNAADPGKVNWANTKIAQAVSDSKRYQFNKFGH